MRVMTIRAPEELQRKLSVQAKKKGLTRNAYILQVLWQLVKDKEK